MNVSYCGNGVFADVIKFSSYFVMVAPYSNEWCPSKGNVDTDTEKMMPCDNGDSLE